MLLAAAIVPPATVQEEVRRLARAAATLCSGLAGEPDLHLRITSFGNLTNASVRQVSEAMDTLVAAQAQDIVVRFARLQVDAEGRLLVGMDGDVEGLQALARAVPRAVEGIGLFVDRRIFWPGLRIATVTPGARPLPGFDDLADWVGSEWTVPGVALMRGHLGPQGSYYEELEALPV